MPSPDDCSSWIDSAACGLKARRALLALGVRATLRRNRLIAWQMMRSGMASLLLLLLAVSGIPDGARANEQPNREKIGNAGESDGYETSLPAESIARGPCEAKKGRVFVAHGLGSECVSYFVIGDASARSTIFFFDGDVPPETLKKPKVVAGYLAAMRAYMANRATAHGVRYVYVSRIGVFGSSGNHSKRKSAHEVETMSLAVDAIKERLGVARLALAGQSGGSMVAAGMLALGRKDVSCAVLASGVYDMPALVDRVLSKRGLTDATLVKEYVEASRSMYFDVIARTAHVVQNKDRRIFVLGDPRDQRTPFDMQQIYAASLKGAGHHAAVIEGRARDREHHALTADAIELAGRCARGESEASLRRGLR